MVSGSAEIRRGRVGPARFQATQAALLDAVWQRAAALLAPEHRKETLRRSMGVKVRELIARYRTRKVLREAKTVTVRLEVTVDEAALRRRLAALGIPLLAPGVLLVAHCDSGPMGEALTAALASSGIRAVPAPWSSATTPAHVAEVRARPEAALAKAREAETSAALVASCHPEPGQAVAPRVTSARIRVLVTLHGARAASPTIWQQDASATSLGPDAASAAREALKRALSRLARPLATELPRQLPAGPRRALRLQILGALPLQAALGLAGSLPREAPGVEAAHPDRFGRGETWLKVYTTLDVSGLRQALGRVTPPPGFTLSAQVVQPGGQLALSARLSEENP
ncbi:MAG: hypothetical protein RBU30_17170 [Polyangia bacterium]|jgi:hypothetical protein|nr:hypothetical protein [Polyangia bacterium]